MGGGRKLHGKPSTAFIPRGLGSATQSSGNTQLNQQGTLEQSIEYTTTAYVRPPKQEISWADIRDEENRPSIGLDLKALADAKNQARQQETQANLHSADEEPASSDEEEITQVEESKNEEPLAVSRIRTKFAQSIVNYARSLDRPLDRPLHGTATSRFQPGCMSYRFDLALDEETGRSGSGGGQPVPAIHLRTATEVARMRVRLIRSIIS